MWVWCGCIPLSVIEAGSRDLPEHYFSASSHKRREAPITHANIYESKLLEYDKNEPWNFWVSCEREHISVHFAYLGLSWAPGATCRLGASGLVRLRTQNMVTMHDVLDAQAHYDATRMSLTCAAS